MGLLEVTCVRCDVCEVGLFCAVDSVCFDSDLVMSDVMGDGDEIPMTTAARSRGSGSGCCGWLKLVSQGAGPVAPPINERWRTVGVFQNGEMVFMWIVYTQRESVGVLRVTGSLIL